MQKIIPPYFLVICIVLMFVFHYALPYKGIVPNPYNFLGIVLIIIGLLMARNIRKTFSKVDTEIHTFKKPRQIVVSGLFRYSRNPIYLSFVFVLIGLNIILGTVTPFVMVMIFILVTHYWYIPFEEKNMLEQFGADYETYRKNVRRWI